MYLFTQEWKKSRFTMAQNTLFISALLPEKVDRFRITVKKFLYRPIWWNDTKAKVEVLRYSVKVGLSIHQYASVFYLHVCTYKLSLFLWPVYANILKYILSCENRGCIDISGQGEENYDCETSSLSSQNK